MASSRCRVSALHLRPNVRNESRHTEFGIDTLNLFADDQAVLCQIEKRALLSHVQMSSLFRRPVISARVKMITYPDGGMSIISYRLSRAIQF